MQHCYKSVLNKLFFNYISLLQQIIEHFGEINEMVSNYLTGLHLPADQVQSIEKFINYIAKAVFAIILNTYQELYPEPTTRI
jgi:hypothetical protein